MRVLLLGTGGIGARHAANVRALVPGAEFIAVRRAPNEVTERFGMRTVPDLAAGLRAGADIAIVALPPALHARTAAAILEAGIHLYLEKPVALRAEDLIGAARKAESRGVVTLSGCILRRMPGFRRLAQILADGLLGAVLSATVSAGSWLPGWRRQRDYRQTYSASQALGGGVIYDLIHELDLCRMLFGELDVASATVARSGALEADVEDVAEIVLRRGELLVHVHLDYLDRVPHRCGRLIGKAGTAEYDAIAGRLALQEAGSTEPRELAGKDDFSAPAALRDAMTHFLDCVARRSASEQPISDALGSVGLAEQARRLAGLPA